MLLIQIVQGIHKQGDVVIQSIYCTVSCIKEIANSANISKSFDVFGRSIRKVYVFVSVVIEGQIL